ncbi:MAG TPA: bifunctional 5,10-methylene-tetrahydrofolate dehydrogenase/5,10-methylene-tetrahydrofolate cyclohydrolase [Opitutae bacterium]|nr:bifunctional 5,10-methylene-tetrahydrofolate dehydrogenase/5,10-methylene-tetrahydrofolate cyclohydrolase [Opitutae bacterium]|tara:strand:- start:648 stop:1532 length:885 start_codon:yes stop_codon:yes gene_type:complete
MELIDGKAIAESLLQELEAEVKNHVTQGMPIPTIAFIRVGEDPASITYVRKKESIAARLGFKSRLKTFPEDVTEAALFACIDDLNKDTSVHGILIQAPLPNHLSEQKTFNRVSPKKDVDGFSSSNLGKLCQEDPHSFVACTPAGIVELLKQSNVTTAGKHIVILGRSLIVGKPAALIFMGKGSLGNATVTVCHSQTKDLASITQQADILIAAVGKPHLVTESMVKKGAIVIDVGMNRIEDSSTKRGYRLTGDVDFDRVAPRCSKITPAPGGVGPMTVAMLMKNTWKAYQLQTSS